MEESVGDVTLIALMKYSWQLAQQQILRLKSMLKFLQSTGLTDIRFIIINSQQTANDFNSLLELVKDSGIKVYQETSDEPIWRKLEGGKDDMFVYDR